MASLSFLSLSSLLLLCLCSASATVEDDRKAYIVYMGALPSDSQYSAMSHHQHILQQVTSSVENSLVRNYGRSFNGFEAKLTESEREKLSAMEGVVSVFPSVKLSLQTTKSWDFMGFGDNFKRNPESDIVVGVIDSGIWPESKSFSDKGLSSPPAKWKGVCKGGSNFTCNNKLIGARFYVDKSARDFQGHGTHTSSTAAGSKVEGASFYGMANGTARGGVPSARIAMYKVCEGDSCDTGAILAAFDDAIADGVDVITISIGGDPVVLESDPISIAAFHAMEKGVLTVQSAGNSGPTSGTVGSNSPWILTVAASTTDRKFVTKVALGNGKELSGTSINGFKLNGTKFPFSYGESSSTSCGEEEVRMCSIGCIDFSLDGKILVCDQPIEEVDVESSKAVGVIIQGKVSRPVISTVPLAVLPEDQYSLLTSYIKSTAKPEGTILKTETTNGVDAPVMASFSSRGPNTVLGDILKPDITAPGVNILAAYSAEATLVPGIDDGRRSSYSFLSGTSMSCPHVTGVAAYLKSVHPKWSTSTIKSAIMTTAWPMNVSSSEEVNEFAYGSGHLNPTKAADPGLVYEITGDDYLKMLCSANYTASELKAIAGRAVSCPKGSNLKIKDLNYPSMSAKFSSRPSEITFLRTVTNVGPASSTYKAEVVSSSDLKVEIKPNTLSFKSVGEKKSFTVKVSGISSVDFQSATLVWSDGSRTVRSPIVIYSYGLVL
ncbi:PREDICTED: subtilisin-like protease SBT4.5 [Tarenaya hassleriana]|uniref:subtilisin-like protease SBT4.5 n=1 Tax=Tarenaya hassleriana TaxID=28532 RepID=UPI0008FD47B7|nr:PREDICTED: subtilisin-like protease SBT4.5 [Tarenaya hassleriana]